MTKHFPFSSFIVRQYIVHVTKYVLILVYVISAVGYWWLSGESKVICGFWIMWVSYTWRRREV